MRDLAVFGLGELGKLYGAGALAAGFRVTPVSRSTSRALLWAELPAGVPLLVAVSEASLQTVRGEVPPERKGDLILLQNELFPSLWSGEPVSPTVMVPWVLKKPGLPLRVLRATQVHGRHAEVIVALHRTLDLECAVLHHGADLARELSHKYAFILTINALSLWRPYVLADFLAREPERVRVIATEASMLAGRLAGVELDLTQSLEVVVGGMAAMGEFSALGRSAQARVDRALAHAERLGLALPGLEDIAHQTTEA